MPMWVMLVSKGGDMGIGSEEKPGCDSASAAPQHVLMLPGLDGSGSLSTPFLSALQAHGLTTQAITLPAQGGQDHATLAQRLWSQLPGHPFILLAESFSGPLAVELATRHPTGLRGLVLARQPAQPCCRRLGLCLPWRCWRACCWGGGAPASTCRCCAMRWSRFRRSRCGNAPQRPCGSTYAHCCRQSKCRRCACTRAMTACCGRPAWQSCRPFCRMLVMFRWKGRICYSRRAPTQLQPKLPRG